MVLFSRTVVKHTDGKDFGRWWRFSLPIYLNSERTDTVVLDTLHQLGRDSFFYIDEVLDITDPACPKTIHGRL